DRRRAKQVIYNKAHGITPKGIIKAVKDIIDGIGRIQPAYARELVLGIGEEEVEYQTLSPGELARSLKKLEKEMLTHARNLEFEQAAAVRDKIQAIQARQFGKDRKQAS